jgi:acetylornithine/succinyldiaminopimelate/putrescine aminotransferase
MGRTGTWWAYEQYGVIPDILTSAKALGGGVPIGACLARGRAATTFTPGDHGSTFAGNPLATSAAMATIEAIEAEGLVENARAVGAYFMDRLRGAEFSGRISEVRGAGLMVGAQLSQPRARTVMLAALEQGLIINAIGDSTLRFLPPLITTKDEIDEAIGVLDAVI